MSKIISLLFFSLLVIITISTLLTHPVYALGDCPSKTAKVDPIPPDHTDLLTSDRKAKFTITLGEIGDSKFTMKFNCPGIIGEEFVEKVAEKEEDNQSISATLDMSSARFSIPCPFQAGSREIIVEQLIDNRKVPQCTARYNVTDANTLCELEITPQDNIYSDTKLTISGSKLNQNERFGLFMDATILKGRTVDFVDTTNGIFSGIEISNLTPGSHSVSLRKYNLSSLINSLDPKYGPPLCVRDFTVGVKGGTPGKVTPKGTTIAKGCTQQDIEAGKCSSGGGKPIPGCGIKDENNKDDPRGPGIATALGCIHTTPAELVKDLMTWVLGIGGGLAFLMMLLGAFQMLTSAGNPETLNAGKDRLTSAVIGLLLVIFAILLLQIIGVGILKIPGFG